MKPPPPAADIERGGEARRAAGSMSTGTAVPRLQWVFLVLVVLSVLSVWAISSRVVKSTPRLKRLQQEAPHADVHGVATHTTLQNLAAVNTSLSSDNSGEARVKINNASHIGPELPTPTEVVADFTAAVAAGTGESSQDGITIPHFIHQSWKSRGKIPARFHPWMRSWVELHPTWTYVFWTDVENLQLFEHLYPQYLHVAQSVGKISLADMARYALLHHLGGLYVDVDFECKKPFDDLHRMHRLFLSSEPRAHSVLLENSDSLALCNALMASAPGHPFWLRVLNNIKTKFDREGDTGDAVALTGPRIVKQTYFTELAASTDTNTGVDVLPPEYFYPEIAYWNAKAMQRACHRRSDVAAVEACAWLRDFPEGEFTENTRATHHWQCTWCQGERSNEYSSLETILGKNGASNSSTTRVARPSITTAGIELVVGDTGN